MAILAWAWLAVLTATAPACAGAVADARWQAFAQDSTRQIDHSLWQHFLQRYLKIGADGAHLVAYGAVSAEDRASLDRYLAALGAVDLAGYARPEQLAFWMNLYNARLVRLVLEHYPVGSIQEIHVPPDQAAWDQASVQVAGVRLSLADIQERILSALWHDTRIYYGLSCAAVDCPSLPPEPFTGARVERQLNQAAMAYVNDPRCVAIEADGLRISSLYRWHQDEFGGSDLGIIQHILAFAEPHLAMQLQSYDRISRDGFDWRLNDAAP